MAKGERGMATGDESTRLGETQFLHGEWGLYRSPQKARTAEQNAGFEYSGGAGIFFWGTNLILNNVTISHNLARILTGDSRGVRGGGIYFDGQNAILENVTISDNNSWEYGGGIYSAGANTSLKNVIILRNVGGWEGD